MKKDSQTFNFGKAFEELEQIAKSFESENMDIDDGLKKFERGLELAQKLKAKLRDVESKVETIKKKFSDES